MASSMMLPARAHALLLPDVWRTVCAFLPVGGPDGQWRIKQVCRGLMPADVDRARMQWNERYEAFKRALCLQEGDSLPNPMFAVHLDDNPAYIVWTAYQKLLLEVMALKVVRLFRPQADLPLQPSLAACMSIPDKRRSGVSTALQHFTVTLLAHTPVNMIVGEYAHRAKSTAERFPSSRLHRRTMFTDGTALQPVPRCTVIISDYCGCSRGKMAILRPGGVLLLLRRSASDVELYRDEMASTPYAFSHIAIVKDASNGSGSRHTYTAYECCADGNAVIVGRI